MATDQDLSSVRGHWQQWIWRHCVIMLIGVVLMAGTFYTLPSTNITARLSMASAYASLVLLCVSLLIGPWQVLRGRPNPLSTAWRRAVGIWAGLLGFLHVIVGLQVHMKGQEWLYFFDPDSPLPFFPARLGVFGFANYTGLGATFVLILLLGLSNDFWVRILGGPRWKAFQRWNYIGFIFVVIHGFVYQYIEKRQLAFVGLFAGLVGLVIAIQLAGMRKVSRMQRKRGR